MIGSEAINNATESVKQLLKFRTKIKELLTLDCARDSETMRARYKVCLALPHSTSSDNLLFVSLRRQRLSQYLQCPQEQRPAAGSTESNSHAIRRRGRRCKGFAGYDREAAFLQVSRKAQA